MAWGNSQLGITPTHSPATNLSEVRTCIPPNEMSTATADLLTLNSSGFKTRLTLRFEGCRSQRRASLAAVAVLVPIGKPTPCARVTEQHFSLPHSMGEVKEDAPAAATSECWATAARGGPKQQALGALGRAVWEWAYFQEHIADGAEGRAQNGIVMGPSGREERANWCRGGRGATS